MEAAPQPAGSRATDDEDLVNRFRAGDETAFDALVDRHRRAVYRLAYRMTGRHEDADDLSQEAFLRMYTALHRFRGESSFRTWMTRIVVNLAIDARRSRRQSVPFDETAEAAGRAGDGPAAALRGQIRRAVGTLPRRQRQILMLKVYGDMRFSDVAAAAGISIGTAKATFFQAVQALKVRLAAPGLPSGRREVGSS